MFNLARTVGLSETEEQALWEEIVEVVRENYGREGLDMKTVMEVLAKESDAKSFFRGLVIGRILEILELQSEIERKGFVAVIELIQGVWDLIEGGEVNAEIGVGV